jgi:signal transduction histidine kinase
LDFPVRGAGTFRPEFEKRGGPSNKREAFMATLDESGSRPNRSLPEVLVRTVRHEVGDHLQTIYAAVAILQKRLPPEATVERRVLADLRSRAEGCKRLLDHVSDLVSPLSLSFEPVDLAQLAGNLAAATAPRYPNLEVRALPSPPVTVLADEKRLAQVGEILLTHACEAARHQVTFRTHGGFDSEEAEWTVTDDGPGIAPQELAGLFTPFDSNRFGYSGIGLALAHRLVLLHGGRTAAENLPEGGSCIRAWLPTKPPASSS